MFHISLRKRKNIKKKKNLQLCAFHQATGCIFSYTFAPASRQMTVDLRNLRSGLAKLDDEMGEIIGKTLELFARLCCIGLLTGCYGPVDLGRDVTSDAPDGGTQGEEVPAPGPKWKSLYVTGVEYPSGFPWRYHLGDPPEGTVLFLMKDGRRIVELELDKVGETGAEADMHWCVNGHLYTDFSTETETVLKRDGVEMFRFPGREMIVSFLLESDDVYTLSVPRSGTGWVYRKNGEVKLYKGIGSLFPSGLHLDGGRVCFGYEDTIPSSSGDSFKWFFVVDAEVKSMTVPDDVTAVDDAIRVNGEILYIAHRRNIRQAVLAKGLDCRAYELFDFEAMSGCRFLKNRGEVFTYAVSGTGSSSTAGFWKMTERVASFPQWMEAVAWESDGSDVFSLCTDHHSGDVSLCRGSDYLRMEAGCCAIFDRTVASSDGRCCAAVARRENLAPALWMDGKLTEYDFNGVFTSVSWW